MDCWLKVFFNPIIWIYHSKLFPGLKDIIWKICCKSYVVYFYFYLILFFLALSSLSLSFDWRFWLRCDHTVYVYFVSKSIVLLNLCRYLFPENRKVVSCYFFHQLFFLFSSLSVILNTKIILLGIIYHLSYFPLYAFTFVLALNSWWWLIFYSQYY